MRIMTFFSLLRDTYNEWSADKVPRLGAALAYYSVFSIAPLIVIAIGAAGLIFGKDAAEKGIVHQIQDTVGKPVAQAIETMLVNVSDPGTSWLATLIGLATLLVGAAGVFGQLQDALNTVWKVTPKPGRGFRNFLRDRFMSLTMVLGTGFLLLISLIGSAVLAALSTSVSHALPGGVGVWQAINVVISFSVISGLFAMIYKFVPDVKVAWRDVWVGAVLAAILFTGGKFLLGWYLGQASTTSAFGAAGSLVVILLWVYYASQILLFGAEFTRVYAGRFGSGVEPAPNAMLVLPADLARQGLSPKQTIEVGSE
jgi:membrane protein